MIRLAVVGTNFITDRLLSALPLSGQFSLTAVYSRSLARAEEYGKAHGASYFYNSLEELAKSSQVDAVYVASPNSFHAAQSIMLLTGKKHVLCEKPAASNAWEWSAMVRAAERNGVVVLEAMRPVFHPGFQAIKDCLPRLGTLRRATFIYCQYSSRYDKFKNGTVENAFDPRLSNSALMDIGCYCVHPLVALFGRPSSILAQSVRLSNGFEGAGTILAAYPQMQAELLYSKISNSKLSSEIQGENGSMLIEGINIPKKVTLCWNQGKQEQISFSFEEQDMCYELNAFAQMIYKEQSPKKWNHWTELELELMDEARKQAGIFFPADSNRQ